MYIDIKTYQVYNIGSMEKLSEQKIVFPIILGILIGAILKFFVIDIVHVSGSSMMPAIKSGDVLVVNKLAFGLDKPFGDSLLLRWGEPSADDVVIFMRDGNMVVKRVVAVGGTALEYSTLSGYNLIVSGARVPLSAEQFYRMKSCNRVPDGTVFVLGDNFEVSVDSRSYGFVPINNILGKVIFK